MTTSRNVLGTTAGVALLFLSAAIAAPSHSAAAAPRTQLFLDSEFGDPVANGFVFNRVDGVHGSIGAEYEDDQLVIWIDDQQPWLVVLAAPDGNELTPGVYANSTSSPTPGAGRLWVDSPHGPCQSGGGTFVVEEAAFDGGDVLTFSGRFEFRCTGATAAIFGEIRVNSSVDILAPALNSTWQVDPATEGTTSTTAFEIENRGTVDLSLGTPTITGERAAAYSIASDDCTGGPPLEPSASCTMEVQFAPTIPDVNEALLTIPDDTARGARVIRLTGQGVIDDSYDCEVAVAAGGTSYSLSGASVTVDELLAVFGFDWQPISAASIDFIGAADTIHFSVSTDANGEFLMGFAFESGSSGRWTLRTTSGPGCIDMVAIQVAPFTDILSSGFLHDIKWLYFEGVTRGCTASTFCPNGNVTRGQMAAFLSRALRLPATARDYFTDDEGSSFEGDINRMAAAGITGGCASRRFCPNASVTREQMASFLARAFRLPAASVDYFTDDESSAHEQDINRVAAAGLSRGCTASTFCGKSAVTRGQMAAFLRRALD